MDRVPILLPLTAHPLDRPYVWEVLRRLGDRLTVAVNVDDGPGTGRDPLYTAAMTRLAAGGVRLLGHVRMAGGARPVADVVADIDRWAGYPVSGVFLDRCPSTPFAIGPVAIAVRAAHRADLPDVVLNPGVPPDPIYRDLAVTLCAFDGSWREYRRWSGSGSRPGDGHIVHAVPPWEFADAMTMMTERGAGFGLITDLGAPDPYGDLPAWCAVRPESVPRLDAAPVGTSGR